MRRVLFTFVCVICFVAQTHAQSLLISGQVIDNESKKGIQSITVLLKNKTSSIIAFKMSDAAGNFQLQTAKDTAGAYIEINHLGYKKKRFDFSGSNQKIIIALEQNTILLEDVEIKSKPRIQQKGDTIAYNVSSFSKEEDRSIGDVLKRMPGIEVAESGQIKYQGKTISNFYIDGDDLLKNKYNIGTKTIAHNIVKDVQVLNNHEHMKVLKNKRYTEDVALNLVIKDEATLSLSGQIKLGAGFPNQYDAETNTVLFNKKYKGLNVLKGNNSGNELKGDVIGFNSNNVLASLGRSTINNLLSLETVGNPPLQSSHYLMNNSFGVNANNLFNLKRNWQVTSNVQGVFERSEKGFAGVTTYLTNEGNIGFDETQTSRSKEWLASLNFTLAKNMDKFYFNNELALDYENEKAKAYIQANNSTFDLKMWPPHL